MKKKKKKKSPPHLVKSGDAVHSFSKYKAFSEWRPCCAQNVEEQQLRTVPGS